VHVDLASPATGSIVCKFDGDPGEITRDSRGIALLFAPDKCHVFDAEGQRVEPYAVNAGAPATLANIVSADHS
jgi:hypothetical protein